MDDFFSSCNSLSIKFVLKFLTNTTDFLVTSLVIQIGYMEGHDKGYLSRYYIKCIN